MIELISELSKVCPDKAIAANLNRLGYKTGQEKTWNHSRVLIREHILPAKHLVEYAWIIDRKDLSLPAVQQQVKAVHDGRRLPHIARDQGELSLG